MERECIRSPQKFELTFDPLNTRATKTPSAAASLREQRRLQHQDLSRTQLLDAAEIVFGRNGFHDATIKAIAEAAEFSVGSVYSFFENKDDLFHQMFVRRGEEFMHGMRAVAERLEHGELAATEALHQLVDFQIGFFREHPYFSQIVLRHANTAALELGGDVDEVSVRNYRESMRLQAAIFERGQATGELRPGDGAVLSALFSGMVAAYQLHDPAVVRPEGGEPERLPIATLHEMVTAAFTA